MSAIENKGQYYLKKWLSGEITYSEELELFKLAEEDEFLQAALEGYIGQDIYESAKLPFKTLAILGRTPEAPAKRKRSFAWMRYVAGIAVLIAVAIVVMNQSVTPQVVAEQIEYEPPVIETNEVQFVFKFDQFLANDDVEELAVVQTNQQPAPRIKDAAKFKKAEAERQSVSSGDVTTDQIVSLNDLQKELNVVMAVSESEEKPANVEVSIEEEGLLTEQVSGSMNKEADLLHPKPSIADVLVVDEDASGLEPIALQFSNEGEEDLIREDAFRNKDEDDDDVIKGYEIDIRSGVSPADYMNTGPEFDSTQLAVNSAIEARVQLADAAATSNGEIKTKRMNNNVVITEYKIEKRDLTNPPISDYNSLVREKYKRKARPETGFFKYKQYLRSSTACLKDVYRTVDYLEEAVIKFRVHRDGRIEFIELFGVSANDCVEDVRAQIVAGPKWDVATPYESIDVEVPFKVLHPYWY